MNQNFFSNAWLKHTTYLLLFVFQPQVLWADSALQSKTAEVVFHYNKMRTEPERNLKNIFNDRSKDDQNFWANLLKRLNGKPLPEMRAKGEGVEWTLNKTTYTLKPVQLSEGIFLVQNKRIQFRADHSLSETYYELEKSLSSSEKVTFLPSLISEAYASPGVIAVAVGIIALAYWFTEGIREGNKILRSENYLKRVITECNNPDAKLVSGDKLRSTMEVYNRKMYEIFEEYCEDLPYASSYNHAAKVRERKEKYNNVCKLFDAAWVCQAAHINRSVKHHQTNGWQIYEAHDPRAPIYSSEDGFFLKNLIIREPSSARDVD